MNAARTEAGQGDDQKSGAHGVSYAILVGCARLPEIVGKPAELSVFRQKGGRGKKF
jgi:hypothetical protein